MADNNYSSLEIRLKRVDRIYHVGETVEGTVVVHAYKGWSHTGVKLVAEGVIHLSSTSRGIMGLGTDYNGRQIQLMKFEQELCGSG